MAQLFCQNFVKSAPYLIFFGTQIANAKRDKVM